jgi:hypothetical protein
MRLTQISYKFMSHLQKRVAKMYVCMCVCMYVCMYVCMCVYVCIKYSRARTRVYMYVYRVILSSGTVLKDISWEITWSRKYVFF